ncbi:MAG: type II secretion system protein [Alkalibacterium sp.]|uniref:type II secretion system protein n=1 Tax=Alkalibacterium sp. TaxID=1872447 RepID=UPI003970F655
MSLNKKKEHGFVMVESLVSLSILALFMGVVFPFSLELLTIRAQAKVEIELSRFLYESALFYDMTDPKNAHFSSGKATAASVETNKSIRLYVEDTEVRSIEFLSAEW